MVMAYDTGTRWSSRRRCRLGLKTSALFFRRLDVAVVMVCLLGYLAGMAAIPDITGGPDLYYAGLVAALFSAVWQFCSLSGRATAIAAFARS